MLAGRPPSAALFLNGMPPGELGDALGGSAVKELVIVTICCRGFPTIELGGGTPGEKGIKGGGATEEGAGFGGVFEPPKVSSDLVSRSSLPPQLLSLSRLSFVKS